MKRRTFYKRRTLRHFLGILLTVVMVLSTVPTDGLSLSVNAQETDTGNRCEGGGGNTLDNVSYMKLAANADVSDESGTNVATVTVNGSETTEYSDLQEAWKYAAQKGTEASPAKLKLLKSVDMGTSKLALENANSSIILEMNDGVTLTSSCEYGVIQIKNGKLTMESGKIVCDYMNGCGVDITNGEFILKDGEISGKNMYYGVYANNGIVEMENGKINANNIGIHICNFAKFTMTEGSITSNYGVYVYGEANIKGGTITSTGYGVTVNGDKGGKANINGSTKIESSSHAVSISSRANVTIGGNAQLNSSKSIGVNVSGGSTVSINDNVEITGNYGVSLALNNSDTNVKVNGGTINGSLYGVNVETGKLDMSNGKVSASATYGSGVYISNSGNADISGGKVNGGSFGLRFSENSTGNVTISGGTFTSNINSVNNGRGAVRNLLAEDRAYFKGEKISGDTRICDDNILAKNNLAASDGYGTVTVAQVPLEITKQPESQSWTYGDKTDHTLTVQTKQTDDGSGDITYKWYQEAESGSGIEIENAISNTYSLTNFNAGDYKYYCVVTCGNYEVTSKTIEVNILPKKVTAYITGDFSKNKTYDGTTSVTGSVNISLEGVVNNDSVTATASYSYDSPDAGERTITASGITLSGESANNYNLSSDSATVAGNILPLNISNANANVKFDDNINSLVYDGIEKEINVSSITVQVNGDERPLEKDTDYTLSGNTAVEAGTYTCTIAGKGNFIGEITKEWNISKCPITIVPDSNQFKEYGAGDPELTYTITSGSVAKNDVLSSVLIRDEGENVGTYEITKSSNANTGNPNYDITVTNGVNFKIIPSSLEDSTITLSNAEYTYDGTEKKPNVTVSKNGMTLEKDIDYIENYTDNTNAGTATVTITAKNGNYVGTIKKEFSIIQATPEIYTAPSVADRVYNPFMSLKDSDLTGGKVSVNGAWSWQSKDIVPTVDNNGYVAVFTPNDSNNYKTVTLTIPVAVTKAVPYIASPPAAAAITYGDALHTSELTGGTVQYGNGAGQAGSEIGSTEKIAGVFTWKDASIVPTLANSDVTEYTVVFTPDDSTNYSVAETKITITVNEARKPQNTPSGNIIVTEPVIGEDAPHISIVGSEDEIKEAVPLTEEEKAAVAAGSEIKIYLKIEKKTVTQEEKQIIDAAKEDYIIGEYIDVSMFKQIDGKEESPVRQLNKKIKISLIVPENLRNKNNNLTRIYAIIHHHSGEDKAEILQGVYDERTFSFTFTTDRFSTYTIVYKDTEKQTGNVSYPIINGGGYATDFTQTSSPYPSVKPSAMPTAKPSQIPQTSTAPDTSVVPDVSAVPTQEPVQDNVTPAPSKTPSDKTAKEDKLALNAGFKVSQTGNKIKILWGEVSEADGYDVYAQYCGKKFNSRPSNSVKSGKVTKISVQKINGKKLNLKKSYKLYVAAYKLVNGKKIIMCKSIIAHNAGIKNKKYTNVKDIKVKKTSYTLKEGETAKINAITVLVDKKKKMLSDNHAKEFRYATSDKEVAVVSSSGKIKATKKGSCIIYVYGKNGNTKKIKVKVK